jgi:hypothetical protein
LFGRHSRENQEQNKQQQLGGQGQGLRGYLVILLRNTFNRID